METLFYILEVIRVVWPVAIIMGMIAIPILWMWFNESDEEYESLDEYYSKEDKSDESNI